MNFLKELLLLLIVTLFFFFTDKNRCGKGDHILFAHHFMSTFFRLWWLSNNLYMLLFFSVGPVVHLLFNFANHSKCILTQLHNNGCHKPENHIFADIFDKLGFKKLDWWDKIGHYIFTITVWLIAVYKIVNRRKLKLDL